MQFSRLLRRWLLLFLRPLLWCLSLLLGVRTQSLVLGLLFFLSIFLSNDPEILLTACTQVSRLIQVVDFLVIFSINLGVVLVLASTLLVLVTGAPIRFVVPIQLKEVTALTAEDLGKLIW